MRIAIASAVAIFAFALSPDVLRAEDEVVELLVVDDGDFFFDEAPTEEPCLGTTNDYSKGEAIRHWHYGNPGTGPGLDDDLPITTEPLAGQGCLGGPKTFTFEVPEGKIGVGSGSITYTWDQNVPGGGLNDVHLYVFDASGERVYSSLEQDGSQPVNPLSDELVLRHEIGFVLGPGSYRVVEDVYTGEHTAWLTKLRVVEAEPGSAALNGGSHSLMIAGYAYLPGQDGAGGEGRGYAPVTLEIDAGDLLAAENYDPVPHTLTSNDDGLFESGKIVALGGAAQIDTSELGPGDYPFYCRYHPTMSGLLRVN